MANYIVSSGESSNGIILINNSMTVLDGGIVTSTTAYNWVFVSSGGTANNTIVNSGGRMVVSSGGTANSTTVNFYASFFISSGGTASNTIVYSGGRMVVTSGKANNTTVNSSGRLYVSSGGTANMVTVSAGGSVYIPNDGKITGQLTFIQGGEVSFSPQAILDFDISNRAPNKPALVTNHYLISGTPIYTLTVSETQIGGIYTLADYATTFNSTITVQNTFGVVLGMLSLDKQLVVGDISYTLSLDSSLTLTVDAPDRIAPTVSNIHASITTLTNQDVVLTADFSDDVELAQSLYKLGENGEWIAYSGSITVSVNTTVFFKAIDAARNETIVSYEVTNIDKVAPETPETAADITTPTNGDVLVTADFSEDSVICEYSLDGRYWGAYPGGVLFSSNRMVYFRSIDAAGNISEVAEYEVTNIVKAVPYIVEYSADHFEHVLRFKVSSDALDSFRLSTGTYQSRTKTEDSPDWTTVEQPIVSCISNTPQLIKSDADGNADVFFANPVGTWESCYLAQHVGSIHDWGGTYEYSTLYGKNKLADIFEGSTDANILLMTDDDNGDTLFVDDIYTASPGDIAKQQARIAQIDEIRAGAGNDIVDMTSQQFEYIGDGLTIRGGAGNDTIWANKGDNRLFGDAGNDRIVGASGNDVIAGGIGNDRMHGGGGNDVFTFCENWGLDNVEQLGTGTVTLWFASGSIANWDEAALTYTDGENSVRVSGVTANRVTLKFGDDGSEQFASLTSMGSFFDATTERIFEESGKGILANL